MQTHSETESPTSQAIRWLQDHISLRQTTASDFLYDHMESQSGKSLEVIYRPFRPDQRGHFAGRGAVLDFALHARGGRVLDFGPGDGWPGLLIAPFVKAVVGVEGSRRRVQVCEDNARRLGITNATFVHVGPGKPLPFSDATFDAVVAASSIEQTPDPKATLAELHRVLKPAGRLRMSAETLGYYRNGRQCEVWLAAMNAYETRLVLFDRHIDEEYAVHYALALTLSRDQVKDVFERRGQPVSCEGLTPDVLAKLCKHLTDAATWRTKHPSNATWITWLKKAGFRSAHAAHDGNSFARSLFDQLPEAQRPNDLASVDEYLRPIIETIIGLDAPAGPREDGWERMITAEK